MVNNATHLTVKVCGLTDRIWRALCAQINMSESHLTDLRKALEQNHWVVTKEQNGNGYDISSIWVVESPDGSHRFHLEFEGFDDLQVLPINRAYGCRVQEKHEIGAYFARVGRSWPSELARFIQDLTEWST
jgi:hypothetical protein